VAFSGKNVGESFQHVFILGGCFTVLRVAILPGTKLIQREDNSVVITLLYDLLANVREPAPCASISTVLRRDRTDDSLAQFSVAMLRTIIGGG